MVNFYPGHPISRHFCFDCNNTFKVKVHERETGDVFIRCPFCKVDHYRYFKDGDAIHCKLDKAKVEPFVIKGFK